MFLDLIKLPIESDRLKWEAKQVLRDFDKRPHLMVRLQLTGTGFPQRAVEPFVSVGKLRSRFVEISDDGLTANAYFDQLLPDNGTVEFGYGAKVWLRFPERTSPRAIRALDPKLLPKNVEFLDRFFPR